MRDIHGVTLTQRYETARSSDPVGASEAFFAILGLRAPPGPIVPRAPGQLTQMIRYHEVRRVDRVALLRGARDVAKFEDLTDEVSSVLERDLRSRGLVTIRVGPYRKRFDVAVSGAYGAGDLFCVVAARDGRAARVVEAERDRTADGARAAGLALGYPPCCVETFVAAEQGERARREGINEAALRASLGQGGDAPWEMNLLSSLSPLGFIPCDVRCPRALAFARRVLDAVRAERATDYETARTVLRRPLLFFRYPLFFVLDGEPVSVRGRRGVRYQRAVLTDDGTGWNSELRALAHGALGTALDRGDTILMDDAALEVLHRGVSIACWEVVDPTTPMLLRFDGIASGS